ncbi:MAG: hypothetical protein ONB44_12185 [candidate division KSB1 bacterium]|nr:hypothetical protein [candidate division KSB1 bacterium]MDZ7302879.1 hypothetical protein [candidate division KSB1 bacterium]MDZ7310455.1 hypothetical protein [candidate division KSB1 bacterium]
MSFNEILLIVVGGGLLLGTLYMMFRAIFLPSPIDPTYRQKRPASEGQPVKKDKIKA